MQSKIVFREMLSELKALADVQGNYLTKEDVKKFFPGDALNEEQFGLVCEYLVSQKIKVDGYEPAQKTPETAQKTVKEHAERASASNPETEKQEENSETQDGEGPDFLGMYLAELAEIEKLSETEEERLFFEAVNGDSMAKSTLAGQYLETVYELAMTYVASELPIEDLVQEGNIGLLLALENLEAKRCAYDAVQEYIDTIKELKAYSKTDVYLDELDKKLENVIRCSFRNELAPGASTTAAQFILRFGLVAVLLIGGNLVIEGMLSIPMLILFLLFAGRIYDPFTNCFMLLAEVFAALVSIGRMKQIDNTQEQTGSDCCNNIGCDIEFKDVYFSYNEEPVLTGVSFVAKQGEITALVGPSGSGKSTVSKLAARFWDADSGLITLGGIDVKTVEPEVLLKNYAIVFQNVTLFDESVMENIRLGRSGASDEDVRAAAKAAQCDEFIDRLPQGYDTNIGENGSKLSGGERQRISIARALLKNAPVILLDEATASMDAESETMVQTALSALLKGRTVIVIAHRMRTIANADKIVVLDKGKVTEVGTPSELAKKGGLYAHLVALQQKQQMSSLPT